MEANNCISAAATPMMCYQNTKTKDSSGNTFNDTCVARRPRSAQPGLGGKTKRRNSAKTAEKKCPYRRIERNERPEKWKNAQINLKKISYFFESPVSTVKGFAMGKKKAAGGGGAEACFYAAL